MEEAFLLSFCGTGSYYDQIMKARFSILDIEAHLAPTKLTTNAFIDLFYFSFFNFVFFQVGR